MAYVAKKERAFEDAENNPWIIRRRSDGRIKMFRSTGDVRAWSHCKEDRRQYILDLIIADIKKCAGNLIPIDLLAKALQACQGGTAGGGITNTLSSGAARTKIRKGRGSKDKGEESQRDTTEGGSGVAESGVATSIVGVSEETSSARAGSKLDKTGASLGGQGLRSKSEADDSGIETSAGLTSATGGVRSDAGTKILGPGSASTGEGVVGSKGAGAEGSGQAQTKAKGIEIGEKEVVGKRAGQQGPDVGGPKLGVAGVGKTEAERTGLDSSGLGGVGEKGTELPRSDVGGKKIGAAAVEGTADVGVKKVEKAGIDKAEKDATGLGVGGTGVKGTGLQGVGVGGTGVGKKDVDGTGVGSSGAAGTGTDRTKLKGVEREGTDGTGVRGTVVEGQELGKSEPKRPKFSRSEGEVSELKRSGMGASEVGATKAQQTEDPCLIDKNSVRCQGMVTDDTGIGKGGDTKKARVAEGAAVSGGTGVGGTGSGGAGVGGKSLGTSDGVGLGASDGASAGAGAGAGADGSLAAGAGGGADGSVAGAGAGLGPDADAESAAAAAAAAAASRSEGQVSRPKPPECAVKKYKSCGSLPQEKSPCSRLTDIDGSIAKQRRIARSQGLTTYIKNVVMCDDPRNKSAALTVIEEMLCVIQRQQAKTKAAECNTIGEEKDIERLRSIIEDYRTETDELRDQISKAYCTEKKHKKIIIQQSERINQLELWARADRNELDKLRKQLSGRGEETQAYHDMMRNMMKEIEQLKLQNYEHLTAQQEHECQMNRLQEYERELCKLKQERDGLKKKLQKSNCCQEVQVDKDKEKQDKLLCRLNECQKNAEMKEQELSALHKEVQCLRAAKNRKEKEMEWALSKVKGELDKKECIIKQFGNQLVQLQNQLKERECRLREAENSLMEMREQMFELKLKFDANRDEVDKLYEQLCEKGKSLQNIQEQSNSFDCSC